MSHKALTAKVHIWFHSKRSYRFTQQEGIGGPHIMSFTKNEVTRGRMSRHNKRSYRAPRSKMSHEVLTSRCHTGPHSKMSHEVLTARCHTRSSPQNVSCGPRSKMSHEVLTAKCLTRSSQQNV
ncbi:hypothetical protein Bpfe_027063 [Biomphalaria pfeifferi]|uniref:Uncharacterized protein n=1 Tax=Biomphalaria pfeifferi TaxID=112525 RepID=A0AAD8AYR5_BIOPF|nr:hypothetical protein Bpfe_027063 [Biomphalaria pfeifferi]